MTAEDEISGYLALTRALWERGIGVKVKTPFDRSEPEAEACARYSDEAALRNNVEMLIALYLSERFQDFDQWMLDQAPMLGKTKDHHAWILTRADTMRRVADQCRALDPDTTATAIFQNLLREAL